MYWCLPIIRARYHNKRFKSDSREAPTAQLDPTGPVEPFLSSMHTSTGMYQLYSQRLTVRSFTAAIAVSRPFGQTTVVG